MSEAEAVSELVGFTDLILAGLGVFFTIVSAYVAALNYFVRGARLAGRACAFLFVTFVLAILVMVLMGARQAHLGLVARLAELEAEGGLTAAGRAVLANSTHVIAGLPQGAGAGLAVTIDEVVATALLAGFGVTWLALFFLTFVFRWGEAERADGET